MSRFKTELCNNLMELGNCKYGDRCHYAHGAHELRQVSRRHPKYRTERCKNFELTGKCPFGPRCSYVHPKPDLDSMIEQLTRYVQHTKAPKPDSEDDEDETNINSLFPRTTTSSSLLSQCDSSVSSTSNHQFLIDEANKENQQIADFNYYSASTSKFEEDFKSSTEQKLNYIDNPFSLNSQQPSILETHKPLTTLTHNQEVYEQRPPLASTINLTIQRPQQPPRIAMRALSSNSQSQPQNQAGTNTHCNNSSRPSSSSSPSTFDKTITSSNSFGINNPFSDYFNHTGAITDGVTSAPNKQFYTRF